MTQNAPNKLCKSKTCKWVFTKILRYLDTISIQQYQNRMKYRRKKFLFWAPKWPKMLYFSNNCPEMPPNLCKPHMNYSLCEKSRD